MSPHRLTLCALFLFLSYACVGQEAPSAPDPEETSIRAVVDDYQRALRQGDVRTVKAHTVTGARGTTAGGTGNAELVDPRSAARWQGRATLLRRVQVLSPTVATAVGVWRQFDVPAPFDAGAFQYTLLKTGEGWKIAHSHEAFLPVPAEHQIAALVPDPVSSVGPDGWVTLFDGRDTDAWLPAVVGTKISDAWRIEDGALIPIPKGTRSGLLTRRRYLFYELRFEWAAAAESNSGVKYRLLTFDRMGGRSPEPLGPEYQIADDNGDPGAKVDARQRSGALYASIPVEKSASKPLGEWNQGRIVVAADHVEHWLNGTMTARYEVDIPFASAIALQHHTTEVRFRNIQLRPTAR